jgi:predicted ATPase
VVEQAAGERAPGALARRLGGGEEAGTIAERVSGALGAGGGVAGTEETFWAVRRFLEGLARRRPVVVVFEDVHWAQPLFLDLVEHVSGLAQDVPLLLVCLARPELLDRKPAWGHDQPNALSIVVEPLSEDDSAELVQQLVEEAPFSLQHRSRIVETAGGNPLFIEELVRVTTESPEPDAEIARLPPTIQAVLAARLDQLEPDERVVLEAASVIGKELWLAALAELTPEREQGLLRQRLGALVNKDLLRPDEREGAAAQAFRFRHLLIRDAVYEAIPKVRRAELHRRFADWLERSSVDRLTEVQEILAFHLEEAFRYRTELAEVDAAALELAGRAASHLAAAARRAQAREDPPAEISLLSRAVALLPASDSRRLALLPELGDALREAGDFSQAGFVLEEARELAAASGDEAIAAFASVIELLVRFRTDPELPAAKVSAEAQRAVHILQRRRADRWLAKNWELLALIPYRACRGHEAEQALERVVHHARRAGDPRQESRALSLLFGTAVFGPLRVEDGIRRCENALRRYPTSLGIKASATRALATFASMRGDFEQARLLVAHDKALAAELGRPLSSARASIAYGILELLADEPAAAEAELRAGYDSLSEVGEKGWLSHVAPLLAEALYRQGRDDEALELIEEAKQVVAREDLTAQVYWRSPLSKILARQGRDDEAEQLAEEAIEIARRTDSTNLVGDAYKDAADVYLEGGRVDVASAYLRKAINRYDRKGNRAGARKSRRLLAELATPVGNTRV